jgi:hypothetical protein
MGTAMSETFDPDQWVLQHMAPEELDRFTTILETIEEEQAWFAKFQESVAVGPNVIPTEKERADIMEHIGRQERAMNQRNEILGKYANQGQAWADLIDYARAAIQSLFDQGKLHRELTDVGEFWRLVYHQILIDRGREVGRDRRFRNVKILEVLKDWVNDCLPGFAERFREEGNPILAQALEALVDRRNQS